MYRITLNGYDPDAGLITPEAGTRSLSLENRSALVAFLDRLQQAKCSEEGMVGRAMIQGPGVDVEVRSDSGALFLYDRNDPNRQGIPVSPQSFAEDEEEMPEVTEAPIRLKGKQQTSQMMKILGAAVLITVAIQAFFFFSAQTTGPYGTAKVQPVAPAQASSEIRALSGFYLGGLEENPLAVLIVESGRYQFFERFRGDRWLEAEAGELRLINLDGGRALELADGSVLVVLPDGTLDFYGYVLARQQEIPNLEQP